MPPVPQLNESPHPHPRPAGAGGRLVSGAQVTAGEGEGRARAGEGSVRGRRPSRELGRQRPRAKGPQVKLRWSWEGRFEMYDEKYLLDRTL